MRAFNTLCPVRSGESRKGIEACDSEDYSSDVCCELDIINSDRESDPIAVNVTARNNHILAEIVHDIREAHVR